MQKDRNIFIKVNDYVVSVNNSGKYISTQSDSLNAHLTLHLMYFLSVGSVECYDHFRWML